MPNYLLLQEEIQYFYLTLLFQFNLCPEKVVIELTKRQLLEISSLGKEWARFDRSRQHRKWRPLTTVGQK